MDRTNCSAGYASDHVFLMGSDFVPQSCGVSTAVYIAIFTSLTILRGAIAFLQLAVWRARELRTHDPGKSKKRKRLPVFVILSFSSWFAVLLFTILTSLNLANGANGAPLFFMALMYFPLAIQSWIIVARVVRLGRRLIPIARLQGETQGSPISTMFSDLGRATALLNFMSYTHVFCSILACISLMSALISPVYLTFQVGATAYAVQDVLVALGLCYQYQRLISAIRECQGLTVQKSNISENAKLDIVVRAMRVYQVFWIILGPSVAMLWIVNVARIVLPYYWMVMIFFAIETLITGGLILIYIPKEWLRRQNAYPTDTRSDMLSPAVGSDAEGSRPQAAVVLADQE